VRCCRVLCVGSQLVIVGYYVWGDKCWVVGNYGSGDSCGIVGNCVLRDRFVISGYFVCGE